MLQEEEKVITAQNDSSGGGVNKLQEEKVITGLLDGSGEYTLAYEDNEGDRMFVRNVPWHQNSLFVICITCINQIKEKISVSS
ncbi:hypothetical protein AAHE18_20G057000 [Arachis hypogaea]